MSDVRYTPGPWHVDPKAPEESFFEDVNVLRHDGLAVSVCVHNGDITPEEALANAKLVAAAPDLYRALMAILSNHETVGLGASIFQCTYQEVKDARAAVEKATGSRA